MDPKDFPAFPVDTGHALEGGLGHQTGNATWQFPGMTMRDYFAAQAMPGILYMVAHKEHDARDLTGRSQEEKLAFDAYRLADALLKARAA
jgi:hypothetical protein